MPGAYELGICPTPARTCTQTDQAAVVLSLGEVDNLWDESLGTIRISINQQGNVYKPQPVGKGIKETNQDEPKDSLDATQYLRKHYPKGTVRGEPIVGGVVESSVVCKRRTKVNI